MTTSETKAKKNQPRTIEEQINAVKEAGILLPSDLTPTSDIRGIYGFFELQDKNDKGGTCFYVGRANNIFQRMFTGHLNRYLRGYFKEYVPNKINEVLTSGHIVELRIIKEVPFDRTLPYELNVNLIAKAELDTIIDYQKIGQCRSQITESQKRNEPNAWSLFLAKDIAHNELLNITDDSGKKLIDLTYDVVKKVSIFDWLVKSVAWLHRVIEKTNYTINNLRGDGFPDEVIFALDAITRRDNEPIDEYLKRVCSNDTAIEVLLAELSFHADTESISQITLLKEAQQANKKDKSKARSNHILTEEEFTAKALRKDKSKGLDEIRANYIIYKEQKTNLSSPKKRGPVSKNNKF